MRFGSGVGKAPYGVWLRLAIEKIEWVSTLHGPSDATGGAWDQMVIGDHENDERVVNLTGGAQGDQATGREVKQEERGWSGCSPRARW